VNTVSDVSAADGLCTLREAIQSANAGMAVGGCLPGGAGKDTITISATGVITLASALPAIFQEVDIVGPGAGVLTISGASLYRVMQVNAGTRVSLSGVTIANGSMLGGHVHVESHASISGGVAVHHYVTIGAYSFVGGQSRIYHDVPRFMLVDGNPSKVRFINIVGLKRNGITPEGIDSLHEAHRLIYRAKMNAQHAAEILRSHGHLTPEAESLLEFIQAQQEGKHGRGREKLRKTS
jgi:CSLREA domain-containing protein